MAEWYYVRYGQQAGPIDSSQLLHLIVTGSVKAEDLVWRDGMAHWAPASSVDELRPPTTPNLPQPPHPATGFTQPGGPSAVSTAVVKFYGNQPPGNDVLPSSGLGFASFLIGILVVVIELVSIIAATAMVMHQSSMASGTAMSGGGSVGVVRTGTPAPGGMITAGLGMFLGLFLALIGAGLGVGSLFQRRKRIFGILGTVINGGILLLVLLLMVIGLLAK